MKFDQTSLENLTEKLCANGWQGTHEELSHLLRQENVCASTRFFIAAAKGTFETAVKRGYVAADKVDALRADIDALLKEISYKALTSKYANYDIGALSGPSLMLDLSTINFDNRSFAGTKGVYGEAALVYWEHVPNEEDNLLRRIVYIEAKPYC